MFVFFPERITQTVEITKHTVDIEEKGVKLKLTIVDTPGFGDAVNNTEWYILKPLYSQSTERYTCTSSCVVRAMCCSTAVHSVLCLRD